MPYQINPINPYGAYRGAVMQNEDRAAKSNAERLAQMYAANQDQRAAAADTRAQGTYDANLAATKQEQNIASLQRVANIAQQALTYTDPAQRKGYLQQAIPAYKNDFAALGGSLNDLPATLALPDNELEADLQQMAGLAGPVAKPKPEPFTLGPGQQRFGPDGKQIASVPVVPEKPTIGTVNPDNFTPASLDKYRKSGNYADLVPVATTDGAAGPVYDPVTRRTAAIVVASDPARMRDYASFGKTGQAARIEIQQEISKLKKETGMSDSDFVQLRARAKAQAQNIAALSKQNSQITQAEQLARANGQRVLDLVNLIDQTGVPLIEGFSRSARAKAGNVDTAEFRSVLNSFQTEVARLLNGSPTMAGVISDAARNDIQHIASGDMSAAQAKRVINRLFTEMDIRQAAAQDEMGKAVGQTVVGGQSQPTGNQPVRVNTPEDAMRLPPGTPFITPDGRQKVRP